MITLLFEVVDAQTPPSEAIEHLTGGIAGKRLKISPSAGGSTYNSKSCILMSPVSVLLVVHGLLIAVVSGVGEARKC